MFVSHNYFASCKFITNIIVSTTALVVAVALVATGNFALAAGAGLLMIGGIVAAATLGKKIADLAHEIATTESQISTVKTAMAELGIIVAAFNNLDDMYGTLNGFWGGVMNDVSAIKDMDNVTAIQLGYGILEDISSIEASLDMTNNMNAACSRYLEVLNRQGIQIPVNNNSAAALTIFATSSGDCPLPVKPSAQALDEQFHQTVQVAGEMLKKRDDVAYEKIMAHAVTLNTASITAANHDKIATGIWFDIPALRNSASTFGGGISSFTRSIGFPSLFNAGVASGVANNSNTLNGSLNEVRPLVKSTLEGVINLAQVMVAWSDKYPTLPKDITEAANMRARALEVCSEAQNNAALTNNKFADFNGKAQDFSHQIEQSIGTINTQIDARQKQADAELSSVSAPWWVSLGGFFTVLAWEESKKSDIRNDRDAAIRDLESDIGNLTKTLNSGLSFHGQSQSWVNMAAEISGDLGSIYNDLSGISGQV